MMMREIKFRGKRVDNDKWEFGIVAEVDVYKHEGCDYLKEIVILRQIKYDDGGYYVEAFIYANEVTPETVGQFTGLIDRKGSEIYEGDILRNIDNPLVDKLPFKVIWNEYYGAWFWWWESELGEVEADHLHQSIAKNCEVIGNIHDNPELME